MSRNLDLIQGQWEALVYEHDVFRLMFLRNHFGSFVETEFQGGRRKRTVRRPMQWNSPETRTPYAAHPWCPLGVRKLWD